MKQYREAIASLEKAIALDIHYLEEAKTDTDFDSIRELPEFQRIMKTTAPKTRIKADEYRHDFLTIVKHVIMIKR
ncbi:MAG: hypothetical protein GDA44_14180 [Prochloron sp. SP5CPC1]|nr:hypothetical protein [Candidatus Paraprochloron terpiosi SP5CPC1]